jgi:cell division protein ZapA (FtsZ GTPase activity inhibitor)
MNETELQKLVVRFVGDASKFIKAAGEVKEHTEKIAHNAEKSGEAMEKLKERVESLGAEMAKVFAAVGIAFEFKEMVEGAEKWEESMVRMEAVLKANERQVESTMEKYKEFRDRMFETTRASKFEIQALLESAETYGVTGDKAERAVKQAIAASKVVKDSSAEMLLGFSQAIARNDLQQAEHYKRMIRQLRGATTDEELLDKWNKIVAAGTAIMGREMETTAAKVDKARQRMKLLEMEMGNVLIEAIKPAADWIGRQAKAFTELDDASKRSVVQIGATTVALFALNEAGGKALASLKALALNPLTWVAAAAAAMLIYADHIIAASEGAKKLQEALKDAGAIRAKEATAAAAEAEKFAKTHGPEEVEKQIKANQEQLKKLQKQKEELEQTVEGTGFNWIKFLGPNTIEATKMKLENLAQGVKKIFGSESGTQILKFQIDEIVAKIKAFQEANDKLTESLETNAETLEAKASGMLVKLDREAKALEENNQQLQLFKLALQGLDPDALDAVAAKMEQVARATKKDEAFKSVQAIQEQLYWEKKATEAKIAGNDYYNEALEKAAKYLPMMKGLTDQLRQQSEEGKKLQEFQKLKEKFETPKEKFIEEQKKLFEVLVIGQHRWDLYGKAVQEAAKRLLGAAAAGKDAAEYGAESIARIAEYAETMKNMKQRGVNMLPPGVQRGPMPHVVGEDFGDHGWGSAPGDANSARVVIELQKINFKLGSGAQIVKMGPIF